MRFSYKERERLKVKRQSISSINVTPLVDVVLVLLIIFMIASPMMSNGFDVNLPKASANPIPENNKKQIIFTITKSLEIKANDKSIKIDTINRYLEKYNKNMTQIFIKADKQAEYGIIIKVMNIINNKGFRNISLVTDLNNIESQK